MIAQYKPERLVRYLQRAWQPTLGERNCSLEVLLPDERGAYTGTATAVLRNLRVLEREQPDAVAIFAADHVYRMDIRQIMSFHRSRRAHVTVAAVPVPIAEAPRFGVIGADETGRIAQEKPSQPAAMPSDPRRAYVSMGNYLSRPLPCSRSFARA